MTERVPRSSQNIIQFSIRKKHGMALSARMTCASHKYLGPCVPPQCMVYVSSQI